MAVLESSFLIDILRNYRSAVSLLDELERKGESMFVAAPSVMELWEGALKSKVSEKEKAKVDELLASMNVLSLDSLSAKRAAEI
ncbi:MAG: PIN domain-containing protein, partial [Nanoarchaeota archaeon]